MLRELRSHMPRDLAKNKTENLDKDAELWAGHSLSLWVEIHPPELQTVVYFTNSWVPSPVRGQQITSREAGIHDASSCPTELLLNTRDAHPMERRESGRTEKHSFLSSLMERAQMKPGISSLILRGFKCCFSRSAGGGGFKEERLRRQLSASPEEGPSPGTGGPAP